MVAFSKLYIKEILKNLEKEIYDIVSRKTKKLGKMGKVVKILKTNQRMPHISHRFKIAANLRISSANISSIEKVNHIS